MFAITTKWSWLFLLCVFCAADLAVAGRTPDAFLSDAFKPTTDERSLLADMAEISRLHQMVTSQSRLQDSQVEEMLRYYGVYAVALNSPHTKVRIAARTFLRDEATLWPKITQQGNYFQIKYQEKVIGWLHGREAFQPIFPAIVISNYIGKMHASAPTRPYGGYSRGLAAQLNQLPYVVREKFPDTLAIVGILGVLWDSNPDYQVTGNANESFSLRSDFPRVLKGANASWFKYMHDEFGPFESEEVRSPVRREVPRPQITRPATPPEAVKPPPPPPAPVMAAALPASAPAAATAQPPTPPKPVPAPAPLPTIDPPESEELISDEATSDGSTPIEGKTQLWELYPFYLKRAGGIERAKAKLGELEKLFSKDFRTGFLDHSYALLDIFFRLKIHSSRARAEAGGNSSYNDGLTPIRDGVLSLIESSLVHLEKNFEPIPQPALLPKIQKLLRRAAKESSIYRGANSRHSLRSILARYMSCFGQTEMDAAFLKRLAGNTDLVEPLSRLNARRQADGLKAIIETEIENISLPAPKTSGGSRKADASGLSGTPTMLIVGLPKSVEVQLDILFATDSTQQQKGIAAGVLSVLVESAGLDLSGHIQVQEQLLMVVADDTNDYPMRIQIAGVLLQSARTVDMETMLTDDKHNSFVQRVRSFQGSDTQTSLARELLMQILIGKVLPETAAQNFMKSCAEQVTGQPKTIQNL